MNQFNFSEIFKQFGGLKEQMEQVRSRIAQMRIQGEAGAGLVSAEVNGEGRLLSLQIDDELLKPSEKEMLIELVVSAVNDANQKAKEAGAHEMRNMAGSLGIPGLDKILSGLGG